MPSVSQLPLDHKQEERKKAKGGSLVFVTRKQKWGKETKHDFCPNVAYRLELYNVVLGGYVT